MSVDPVYYRSLTEVPSGVYRLRYDDPKEVDKIVLELAGASLFGFAWGSTQTTATPTTGDKFFWSSEAHLYFCFDNIHDEVAIGLRWHGITAGEVESQVYNLLSEVGLGELVAEAHAISPWQLSGGQQQRLLAAVVISRRIPFVVAMNPLAYVEESARAHLYALVGNSVRALQGKLVVAPEPSFRKTDIFTADIWLLGDGSLKVEEKKPNGEEIVAEPSEKARQIGERRIHGQVREDVLRLAGLEWRYDNGFTGVKVSRAQFRSGEIYAVCGPNGAGKSSLLRLLTSDCRVDKSATFVYRGRNVWNPYRDLVLDGKVAFMFQDPNLHITGGTVRDFLLALASKSWVMEAFRLSPYLDQDILSAPLWVRQSAVLAAVLYSGSDVIVLDEPLDGIAYEIFGNSVIKIIAERARAGSLILLITHNPELASRTATSYVWVSGGIASVVERDKPSGDTSAQLLRWLKRWT